MENTQIAAVRQVAVARDYQEVQDIGPCSDGRLVVFGDDAYACSYSRGSGLLGVSVRVYFSTSGDVESAIRYHDSALVGQVRQSDGVAGERLARALELFTATDAH
ncbi:MAG: hypothetical protein WAV90_00620 [Gordonia amarae]